MIILHTTTQQPGQEILDFWRTLTGEAEGILVRLVRAYSRLLARGKFDPPAYSIEEAGRVATFANSVAAWADEELEPYPDGIQVNELYQEYRQWCDDNWNRRSFEKPSWGKQMSALGKRSTFRKVGGRSVRVYEWKVHSVDGKPRI